MPQVCTICAHEARDAMEDAFIAGIAKRRIAAQHGVKEQAVRYHIKHHLPELLVLARDAERHSRADCLLDRIEALQVRTEAILDEVEGTDKYGARLGAIREMRRNLELIGEVTKELNRTPALNLHLSPEWLEVRAVIIGALDHHPEARESVVLALETASNGSA